MWNRFVSRFRIDEIISLAFVCLGILAPLALYFLAESFSIERADLIDNLISALLTLIFMLSFLWLISSFPQRTLILRDFAPFLFIIAIYLRIHDLILLLNPEDFHFALADLEALLFGVQPTVWMEQYYHPVLTDWFAVAYMHYYLVTLTLVIMLYVQNRSAAFRKLMLTMMMTYYLGFMGYLLFPAASPYLVMPEAYSVDVWANTGFPSRLLQWIVSLSPSRARDAFPSLHNAITFLTLLAAWRYSRPFFWIQLPFALSLSLATVYLRYHFVLDIFAGLLVVSAAIYVAPILENWWLQKQEALSKPSDAESLSGV